MEICPLECLPNKSTLSTVNVPFDTDVVVTLALTNDSISIIKLLPLTAASLTTPLATELYLVPPLLTDTTSIAPDTALPVTLVSITNGILSVVLNFVYCAAVNSYIYFH